MGRINKLKPLTLDEVIECIDDKIQMVVLDYYNNIEHVVLDKKFYTKEVIHSRMQKDLGTIRSMRFYRYTEFFAMVNKVVDTDG